ncbi:hypothetical protein LEP1GSC172_3425 [Leptospira noguchii]|uniref:Uncharacterized protein n=1 Tax=Leptospira noguchii TaxID=28182 RepID=M6VQT8_9LEPT|nr:hypothetical protein LEP1GSC172_3425 [Leptospira noguchii]
MVPRLHNKYIKINQLRFKNLYKIVFHSLLIAAKRRFYAKI